MSGKPSREELLSALWEAFVFAESNDADRNDRQKAAFGALRVQRQKYEDAETRSDGLADALMARSRAKTIWTILTTDVAGWLVTLPGFLGLKQRWADYTDGNERAALIEHLNESEAAIPAP